MQLEIGKFYKSRQGTKAMYVGEDSDGYPVFAHYWHNGEPERASMTIHCKDGRRGTESPNSIDIIGEWTEPQSGTVYVNIYRAGMLFAYDNLNDAKSRADKTRIIARKKAAWTEGEFEE